MRDRRQRWRPSRALTEAYSYDTHRTAHHAQQRSPRLRSALMMTTHRYLLSPSIFVEVANSAIAPCTLPQPKSGRLDVWWRCTRTHSIAWSRGRSWSAFSSPAGRPAHTKGQCARQGSWTAGSSHIPSRQATENHSHPILPTKTAGQMSTFDANGHLT